MADEECRNQSPSQRAVPRDPLLEALRTHFGFDSFRPGQPDAVRSLLCGENTLVVMPTGAGKSLVYQMTALLTEGVTLVISPLISLMQDQVRALTRKRIPAAYINSTLTPNDQAARLRAMVDGRLKLVYVAPERLRASAFREAIGKVKVSLLAVDEAHCISQWGHDFRPDYLHIASARRLMRNPVTAALTATATAYVRRDISRALGLGSTRQIVTGFNRPNLSFEVRSAHNYQAKAQVLVEALADLEDGSAIVYAGSRRDSEEISGLISKVAGLHAEFYHAGMDANVRASVTDRFLSGELPVVVATNAFGMGIDRADVRMVVHFTLPGSLEEYYQEAGRAGRDGQQSRAVLIYSPQDTSLHEYFIRSSTIERGSLRGLHKVLSDSGAGAHWFEHPEISTQTGLNEVASRVALSILEEAHAIVVLAVERGASLVECGEWRDDAISAALEKSEDRSRAKQQHLADMVAYAESNKCRRKTILEYFGDVSEPIAEICCDNCIDPPSGDEAGAQDCTAPLTEENKAALLILETLLRLRWPVGRTKLAHVLAGAKSRDMTQSGYFRTSFYGKLAGHRQKDILDIIDQLLRRGYLAMEGSDRPVLKLSKKGEQALETGQAIHISIANAPSPKKAKDAQAKRLAGDSVRLTADMFARGMNVQQIAEERGLVHDTIYGHLAKRIASGLLNLDQVLTAGEIDTIRSAMSSAGPDARAGLIKSILGDAVGYGPINCVLAADRPSLLLDKPVAITDVTTAQQVSDYLSRPHPRALSGPWESGWSLGFHSVFSGADRSRSLVGELVYRLKYCEDRQAVTELVQMAAAVCNDDPAMRSAETIVPMPGSTRRNFDHVSLFVNMLAARTGKRMLPALSKVRATHPQKELRTLAQKRKNVAGAIVSDESVRGKRVLLVDDLFDSGATLSEAARAVVEAGATSVCVLTLTSTIHSDA